MDLLKPYKINASDFNIDEKYFDHQSLLHGINHTYRVMVHILNIGITENLISEARLAFFSAYIHDMSRKHDGKCPIHGSESAQKKLPLFIDFFVSQGVKSDEFSSIEFAVAHHSKANEVLPGEKDYLITAILKDADALDRVRLGENEPDEKYLRFPNSKRFIFFAHQLLESTPVNNFPGFNDAVNTAQMLLNTNTYW